MTEKIICPIDGCEWILDVPSPPEVSDGALAGVFGPGVMAATAAFQHSQRVEDVLAQHYDKHTVESFLRTIRRLQNQMGDLGASLERLRVLFGKLKAELSGILEDGD